MTVRRRPKIMRMSLFYGSLAVFPLSFKIPFLYNKREMNKLKLMRNTFAIQKTGLLVLMALLFSRMWLLPPKLFGDTEPRFSHITMEDGLSSNTATSILQDRKGFLWFATTDGLNRFDGYTFRIYQHNPLDEGTISSSLTSALVEDRDGTLWVGTLGGGLNRFDSKSQRFTRFEHNPEDPDSLSSNTVWYLYEDPSGRLWAATDKGLNCLDKKTGAFTKWRHNKDDQYSLGSDDVAMVKTDSRGNFWVATQNNGLNLYDERKDRFIRFNQGPMEIRAIVEDTSGLIWLGTKDGLWKLTEKENNKNQNKTDTKNDSQKKSFTLTRATEAEGKLRHSIIMSLIEASPGILWAGTSNEGLFKLNLKNNTYQNFKNSPSNRDSIALNNIPVLYKDRSEILWVSTHNGIDKVALKQSQFGHHKIHTGKNSVHSNLVWSFYEDVDGLIWLGTENGMFLWNRKTNRISQWKTKTKRTDIHMNYRELHSFFSDYSFIEIKEDHDGNLWIAVSELGLIRMAKNRTNFTYFSHVPSRPNTISNNSVISICVDQDGTVWLGTKNGLNYFDKKKDVFVHYSAEPANPNGLSNNVVIFVYEDKSQNLWVGTMDGLNLFNRKAQTFRHWKREQGNPNSLSYSHIQCILEDSKKRLWIGTTGGGLNYFHRENNRFTHYREREGLANGVIHAIQEDQAGNLWLSTNAGISTFSPDTETFINYDVADGLQGFEFNGGASLKTRSGELLFGGANGFNAFYPKKITDNPFIPPVILTDFQVMDEMKPDGSDSPLMQDISETKEIILNHSVISFTIDFAALDFTAPDKNRYAFKMEGFHQDWVYRGADRRFVTFTNLDPGSYTFRVIGSNYRGDWNREGVSIKITIIPPFWQTWWFYTLAAVAFALVSSMLVNFIKKYMTFSLFWKKEKYIAGYMLLEKIGEGGMGTVYTAQDVSQKERIVAIKVLKDELFKHKDYRKRFIREALVIDQLHHPHIIDVFERGRYKHRLYIVMEYLVGKTLTEKIAGETQTDTLEMAQIMLQVSEALLKVHSKNIVHRDLKPDNIMLINQDGQSNFVKLLDFGLATMPFQTRLTQTGAIMGTISYMPPEQLSAGEYSSASDIYSLGAIFYETLTGRTVFTGDSMSEIVRQVLKDRPKEAIFWRQDIPPVLNRLVMQMLQWEREKRPTAEEVLKALNGFLERKKNAGHQQ